MAQTSPSQSGAGEDDTRSDLERVSDLIRSRGGPFDRAVADLLSHIAWEHADPILCHYCGPDADDYGGGTCPTAAAADHVAFAWLLDNVRAP